MFARAVRLKEKKKYDFVFKRGQWHRSRTYSVIVAPAQGVGQIGFIVTKKISKSAVTRNRLKRRLRDAFRHILEENQFAPLLKRFNLVVVVHRGTDDMTFTQLQGDVRHVLTKVGAS